MLMVYVLCATLIDGVTEKTLDWGKRGGSTEGAPKKMAAIPYFLLIADYEKAFLYVVCSLEIASLRNG